MPGRKKKKARKPPPKKRMISPLPVDFDCPFCNHPESCSVKIDKERKVGRVNCYVCMENFQTRTTVLSEPIDVYNEWIDACEAANPEPRPEEYYNNNSAE